MAQKIPSHMGKTFAERKAAREGKTVHPEDKTVEDKSVQSAKTTTKRPAKKD